jgi:hypothetical protein
LVKASSARLNSQKGIDFGCVGDDDDKASSIATGRVVDGIDLGLLSKALASLDQTKTKQARDLYNRLYHEAMISAEPGRGMSFSNMLVMLAHYKLIDDDKALQ